MAKLGQGNLQIISVFKKILLNLDFDTEILDILTPQVIFFNFTLMT